MNKINLYFLHLNPCLEDMSQEKSRIIREVFSEYKKETNSEATIGEVRLFSYSPKNNKMYSDILEAYLSKMKKPAILITYSLMDLSPRPSVSLGRLIYALNQEGIEAVYLVNYSKKKQSSEYFKTLNKIFRSSQSVWIKGNDTTLRPGNLLDYKKVYEATKKLRELSPPVLYKDIAEIVGINVSSLKKLASGYGSSYSLSGRGVEITEEQIACIKTAKEEAIKDALNKYDTLEETYLP